MTMNQEAVAFQAARHKELMAASEARLGIPLAWTVRCAAELTWLISGMVPPAEVMGKNGPHIEEHLNVAKGQALRVLDTMIAKNLPSIFGRPLRPEDEEAVSDEIKIVIDAICESEYRVLLAGGKTD